MSARHEDVTIGAADVPESRHAFQLTYMFHPTALVPDLATSEEWYQRVFGLPSVRRNSVFGSGPQDPDNRTDFSTFTMVRDILMDFIDPKLMVFGGAQRFPDVQKPHLQGFGWYVEGIDALYSDLRRAGIKVVGIDRRDPGEGPPTAHQSTSVMFFTSPDDIGLQYQFISPIKTKLDPRTAKGWELGPRREDDPFGIEFTSHHTTLTKKPERMLRLLVDVLGGRVIHEGRNEALGCASTYVRLSDGAYEVAVPDEGTAAHADLVATSPHDCYHSIMLKVVDLDAARCHLEAQGVSLRADTGSVIITDPETSDGIPWGFTADPLPGEDHA